MNSATMFLNQLSCLDHAYIDDRGIVRGGSFHPNFLVGGPIDPVENVVVDFSTVKKEIKREIDHDRYGFDHKCWLIEGYSAVDEIELEGGSYQISTLPIISEANDKSIIEIKTRHTQLELPYDSFKIVRASEGYEPSGYTTESVGTYLEEFLNQYFADRKITVECHNTESAFTYSPKLQAPEFFRYTHGLPFSTSWGCQNMVHGHLSFIQTDAEATPENQKALTEICQDLNDIMFIQSTNVRSDNDESLTLEYVTKARGRFYGKFDKSAYKLVVLNSETTIEHLVNYVVSNYKEKLQGMGASQLFVSEGLSKGAFLEL